MQIEQTSKAAELLSSATYSTAQTGGQVDVADVGRIDTLLQVSGYTDGDHDFTIEHAADDGTGSPDTWSGINADESSWVAGSYPSVTEAADTGVYLVSVVTPHRFIRITTSVSGTTDGATYGAVALLGDLRYDTAGANPATSSRGLE